MEATCPVAGTSRSHSDDSAMQGNCQRTPRLQVLLIAFCIHQLQHLCVYACMPQPLSVHDAVAEVCAPHMLVYMTMKLTCILHDLACFGHSFTTAVTFYTARGTVTP